MIHDSSIDCEINLDLVTSVKVRKRPFLVWDTEPLKFTLDVEEIPTSVLWQFVLTILIIETVQILQASWKNIVFYFLMI